MTRDLYRALLLEMPQQRTVEGLLGHVTRRLAADGSIALARIWILDDGDPCPQCGGARDCAHAPGRLRLRASAGASLDGAQRWDRTDGAFARFTLGERKVGHIARSGEAMEVSPVDPDAAWVADPAWLRRERIVAFGGQPLVFQGAVLGVLAAFSREPLGAETLAWLRLIADHLAASLVAARSFEETESLRRRLEQENRLLRSERAAIAGPGRTVAESAAMKAVLRKVAQVAPTDASILITGESGAGKEVVAREIHARSARRAAPMVRVNCAAIPRELFESEFFGHAKGSFTGAARERPGLFHAADRGTLFLDEVSEIPLELQGKLLRVLQEREYRRVGEEHERAVDVRVVAASNRDLTAAIAAGRFREDLYYRLAVFPIEVPPLRERREDIGPLAHQFLEACSQALGRTGLRLDAEQLAVVERYDWPGNCRELHNLVERAVITATGGRLTLELPVRRDRATPASAPALAERARVLTDAEVRRLERENIESALERCGWKLYGPGSASELLEVPPSTLASRLKAMGLHPPRRRRRER